ncbi:MAG: helicase-related protein, partial [Bacteroidota bacterium]
RAALVVNLDLPWNPAVLEQRIARVHRLGQKRGVQVINLISEGTIEHRMVHTLRFKSQLAEAILDTAADSVFVSDRKFNDFMEQLERIQDAPVTPSAGQAVSDTDLETPPRPAGSVVTESGTDTVADGPPTTNATEATTPPAPEPAASNKNAPPTPPERNEDWQREGSEPNVTTQSDRSPGSSGNNRSAPPHPTGLVARGIGFLDGLTKTLSDPEATQALVEEITEQDAEGNTFLKIPVENQASVANALKLLGGLFGGG